MFGLGFSEIVVLAVLGLILLGPEQLPDMARALGRFINDLKRTTDGLQDELKKQGFSDGQKFLEEIRRETTIETPRFDVSDEASSTPKTINPTVEAASVNAVADSENSNLKEKNENELGKKPDSH